MKVFRFVFLLSLLSQISLSSCTTSGLQSSSYDSIENDHNFFQFRSSFPNDKFSLDYSSDPGTAHYYSSNPFVADVDISTLYTYNPGYAEIELRDAKDSRCLKKIVVNVYGGFELALDEDNGGYVITGYDKNANFNQHEFVFPETYHEIPLVGINNGIFNSVYGPNATVIVLPGSIKTIKTNSFNSSKYLGTLVLKNGILKIEDYAFANCSSLTNVVIPKSVSCMGPHVFYASSNDLKIFCEANQKPSNWNESFCGNGEVYWYSETTPSSEGFWRWVDGKPAPWQISCSI